MTRNESLLLAVQHAKMYLDAAESALLLPASCSRNRGEMVAGYLDGLSKSMPMIETALFHARNAPPEPTDIRPLVRRLLAR